LAQGEAPDLCEDTVRDALARFDLVWRELFPAEQERLAADAGRRPLRLNPGACHRGKG
jgi:hypothetical protein